MRKNRIMISIITAIGVIVLLSVLLIFFVERPDVLGNMNHSYSEQTTSTSNFTFKGETGDKLKFTFASNVVNGNLDIMLFDSQGNKIYELDQAKEMVAYFTLENSDTYTLAADYSDFVGSFKVKVTK